jgi:5,10-methylenetetrahydromethanopterin reductase
MMASIRCPPEVLLGSAATHQGLPQMTAIRFGVSRVASDLNEYVRWVKFAEACGYSMLGVGDSQLRWADCHVALTLSAINTSSITIGTFVSNPVTRHPAVAANVMSTLRGLAGDRVYFGIGNGETSVRDVGGELYTAAEFAEYVSAVRDLCGGRTARYRGHELNMLQQAYPVPLWIAGDGPRMLQLAGRLGDAVIVGNGATPELVRYAYDQVRIGAEQAGRDASAIPVWFMVRILIAESEAAGFEAYRYYLATYANTRYRYAGGLKGIPVSEDIAERLRRFRSEFSYSESLRPDAAFNANLVDRYGLREWLGRQFAVTGPVDQCIEKLQAIAAAGGTNLVLPQLHGDIWESTRMIAKQILPVLSA